MSDNDDLLPAGCYFIQFTPTRQVSEVKHFDGTLRVTRSDDKTRASADLYAHPTAPAAGAFPEHCENPPRETKVPIFPRGQYRFYLEVRGIDVGFSAKDHVCFRFEVHEFNRETKRLEARGSRTAMVAREPNREPRRLRGKVLNEENGEVVGEMTLAWVCASLRRAIVEIDAEPGLKKPENALISIRAILPRVHSGSSIHR